MASLIALERSADRNIALAAPSPHPSHALWRSKMARAPLPVRTHHPKIRTSRTPVPPTISN